MEPHLVFFCDFLSSFKVLLSTAASSQVEMVYAGHVSGCSDQNLHKIVVGKKVADSF